VKKKALIYFHKESGGKKGQSPIREDQDRGPCLENMGGNSPKKNKMTEGSGTKMRNEKGKQALGQKKGRLTENHQKQKGPHQDRKKEKRSQSGKNKRKEIGYKQKKNTWLETINKTDKNITGQCTHTRASPESNKGERVVGKKAAGAGAKSRVQGPKHWKHSLNRKIEKFRTEFKPRRRTIWGV